MKSLHGIPKPESDAELEIVSAYYFGKPQHLAKLCLLDAQGSFEVAEDFESYAIEEYDKAAHFWNWALGHRFCGGVARASYGQFRCGHRQRRRLERWTRSRSSGSSSSVRPTVAKVSRAANGLGENTPNRVDRGVL